MGYLGRLHPKKNLAVLIRAVKLASDDARLLIAGEGSPRYAELLRRIADETGMGHRISWHGFVEGNERWDFLDRLDMFAAPSHYECFGMAAAEAMARGVPTIVSRSSGLAEILQAYACGLVAPPTVEGFSRAIEDLAHDPSFRVALGCRSSNIARLELSMERYGEAANPTIRGLGRLPVSFLNSSSAQEYSARTKGYTGRRAGNPYCVNDVIG